MRPISSFHTQRKPKINKGFRSYPTCTQASDNNLTTNTEKQTDTMKEVTKESFRIGVEHTITG